MREIREKWFAVAWNFLWLVTCAGSMIGIVIMTVQGTLFVDTIPTPARVSVGMAAVTALPLLGIGSLKSLGELALLFNNNSKFGIKVVLHRPRLKPL